MGAAGVLVVLALAGVLAASSLGAFTPAPQPFGLNAAPVAGPTPVPPPAGANPYSGSAPDPAAVAQAFASVGQTGIGRIAVSMMDAQGNVLVDQGADQVMAPASSMKILTTLTALALMGADHQFTTSVVADDQGIILVGGGDPYLSSTAPATQDGSLAQLADLTVQSLVERGQTSVSLNVDTSLFTGPDWHPSWIASYHSDVTPVSALCVDSGLVGGSGRSGDCPAAAEQAFARMLTSRGIAVTSVGGERAGAGLTPIATVASLPLGLIVQQALTVSDNTAAETLFRQVGLASGQAGSFTGGATGVAAELTTLGLWDAALVIEDGSGLSRSDQVSPAVLAKAVDRAVDDPAYADLTTGLPVAAASGTLASRFDDADEQAGRGVVHAKTGSLDGVRTMSGYLFTNSGGLVIFSMAVNDAPNVAAAMDWLDAVAAAVAKV